MTKRCHDTKVKYIGEAFLQFFHFSVVRATSGLHGKKQNGHKFNHEREKKIHLCAIAVPRKITAMH